MQEGAAVIVSMPDTAVAEGALGTPVPSRRRRAARLRAGLLGWAFGPVGQEVFLFLINFSRKKSPKNI